MSGSFLPSISAPPSATTAAAASASTGDDRGRFTAHQALFDRLEAGERNARVGKILHSRRATNSDVG